MLGNGWGNQDGLERGGNGAASNRVIFPFNTATSGPQMARARRAASGVTGQLRMQLLKKMLLKTHDATALAVDAQGWLMGRIHCDATDLPHVGQGQDISNRVWVVPNGARILEVSNHPGILDNIALLLKTENVDCESRRIHPGPMPATMACASM